MSGETGSRSAPTVIGHETVAVGRREVLDSLPDGHTRHPGDPRFKPGSHLGRACPGGVTQHPADRLANEELLLVEHAVGQSQESSEIAFAPAHRTEVRQKGRTPDPEVVVRGPSLDRVTNPAASVG